MWANTLELQKKLKAFVFFEIRKPEARKEYAIKEDDKIETWRLDTWLKLVILVMQKFEIKLYNKCFIAKVYGIRLQPIIMNRLKELLIAYEYKPQTNTVLYYTRMLSLMCPNWNRFCYQ